MSSPWLHDPWVAAQLARIAPAVWTAAERRAEAGHARWLADQAAALLALVLILAVRLSQRVRQATERRGPRPWAASFLCGAAVLTAFLGARFIVGEAAAVLWPIGAVSAGDRFGDALAGLWIGVVAVALGYAVLRALGRWWWAPALVLAALSAIALFGWLPSVLPPALHHDRAAADSPDRTALLAFVRRGGTPVQAIYVHDGDDPTDVDVEGWGPHARVFVSRAALTVPLRSETLAVLGHVMSHARHGDRMSLVLLTAAGWVLGVAAAGVAVGRGGLRLAGAASVADPAGLPLLLLVAMATGLLLRPALNAFDQAVNYRADAEALALTGDPDGLVRWLTLYAPLARPDPGPVESLLFYGHPPLAPRLAAMRNVMKETKP